MNKNIIGKFRGKPVYKITLPEYVNGRYYYNEDGIFLIDGELIYKNEVFATYYDDMVHDLDVHRRRTFYTIPKITVTSAVKTDNRGVRYTELETNCSIPVGKTNYETEKFEPKDVDATLAGVYETDYFSSMTDIDSFLAEAVK